MNRPESDDLVLTKYCNELCSEDKKQRKKALENIRITVLGSKDTHTDRVVSSFEQVQKHIFRCFKDQTEVIREIAVVTVTDIIKIVPPKELYISNLMPIITERLSGDVVLESSEEVRLCLVILLSQIVANYNSYLSSYLNDFVNIFVKTINDPYPKVKKESCDCASELAKSIPQYFHLQSESLINPLINVLSHQQYRIRVSGIKCIGNVVRYGNNKSVNETCGPLAERLFDQHHAVRAAVADVVGMWLLELPDRYSYFHKLIPLMLTSLSEEIQEHRKVAEEKWSKVGKQFMLENESDLKDKIDYLQETLDHYPANVCRPNLGCRTLVQRELSKYLPAIVTELDDWKADVRVKSAQLLCVTVQHAESYVTQHLEKTLPALYKACCDSDTRVSDNIELAAKMIGYFVPPDVYCRLMLPSIQDSPSVGSLRVLAAVLITSQRLAVLSQLSNIAEVMVSEAVCYSRQAEYQQQLLSVVNALEQVMQHDVSVVTQQLFTVLMSVLGLSANKNISLKAQELLERISNCNGLPLQELYKKHTPHLLEVITSSVDEWSLHSPQRFVFEAILTNSGSAVGLNIDKVLVTLEPSLRPEMEPEAVLQTLMAVSYVLTHSEQTLAECQDLSAVIHTLCTKVLQPQLVWRAGRSAEALRTAAVGCVVAALDLLPCPRSLAEPLMPLLLALVEDSAFKTRQFSTIAILTIVKSLRGQNILNAEDINTIFAVVIKRLDDNNNKVRETAVRTLRELFHSPLPADYSPDCYRNYLESLYDTLLLHLDDPSPEFQDIMLDALKEMASAHPQLLRSRIQIDNFRSKTKCEDLIKFLEQTHL